MVPWWGQRDTNLHKDLLAWHGPSKDDVGGPHTFSWQLCTLMALGTLKLSLASAIPTQEGTSKERSALDVWWL